MKVGDDMLKYNLVRDDESKLIYEYFPEGKEPSGFVSYSKITGECKIEELSDNDRHQRYALKMLKKIREFANNQMFKTEGVVAWM